MDIHKAIELALREAPTETFERSELIDANAVSFTFIRPSDLTNPIHPIFRKRNWSGTSATVYATLTPALQLASYFITHDRFLTWWCTLTHGKLGIDRSSQRRILRAVRPTPRAIQQTRRALDVHVDKIRFTWYRKATDDHYGETGPDATKNDKAASAIIFNRDFLRFAKGEYSSSTLSHQLRFQFFFAVMLVHELAHSVYWTPSSLNTPEPFLAGEPMNELGASWEYFAFGGKIQPLNMALSVSADSGLMFYEWKGQRIDDSAIYHALPMNYIGSFFSQARWEAVDEFGTGQFKVPIDAVCKSYQPLTADHPIWIAMNA